MVQKKLFHYFCKYEISKSYKDLTNSQARYIAKYNTIDGFRTAISNAVEAKSVGKNENRISKSDKLSELAELSDRQLYALYLSCP